MPDLKRWKTSKIHEIAAPESRSIAIGPFGSSLRSDEYTESGIPVVRGQDIREGRHISTEDRVFVSEATAARFPACIVRKGDLIFPHRGAIGRVGIVGSSDLLLSSSMMKLTCNTSVVDPMYVFYYFRGPGRDELLARASTVGTPGIGQPLSSLKSIEISYPELAQQRAIAEVLGALDDKIAAERRVTDIAGQLIDARFAQLATNAEDRIPVSETSDVIKGVSYRSADLVASETAMVTLKSISREGRYSSRGLKSYAGTFRESQQFRSGDIAVAQTDLTQAADVVGWATGVPHSDEFKTLVASLDIAIVRPRDAYRSEWILSALREQDFRKHCQARTSGTTVLHLARGAIESYRIPILTESIMTEFSEFSRRIRARYEAGEQEICVLTKTRDELLPLLMSGKLRVKDAEKKVEAIA